MLHGSHPPRFLTLTEVKYLYWYVAIHKQYTIVFSLCIQLANTACRLFFCSTRITLRDIMQRNSGKSIIPVPSLSTCDNRPFIPGTSWVLQTKQGLYVLSNIFLLFTMSIVYSHLVDHVLYLGL